MNTDRDGTLYTALKLTSMALRYPFMWREIMECSESIRSVGEKIVENERRAA